EVAGSGSSKTTGPAAIVNTFAATLVTAMTGTALPTWRLRAETTRPASDARATTAASGLRSTEAAPSPRWWLSALIEVSEAAQNRPAEAPSRTPARVLRPLLTATTTADAATPPIHATRRAST